MNFNHDWWFGPAYAGRVQETKRRCARGRMPEIKDAAAEQSPAFQTFLSEVEARTIVYLRDGFSYEIKEVITTGTTEALSFECTPTEEAYKVGAFVVTVPYDEIVRVEIFACHPKEKPEEMLSIKGFAHAMPPGKREERPVRGESME
jgi:hypothetical protein